MAEMVVNNWSVNIVPVKEIYYLYWFQAAIPGECDEE